MAKKLTRRTKPKVDVTLRNGRTKKETPVKGTPQDLDEQNVFTTVPEGKRIVGLSKGVTVNLGDFQSARINCMIMSLSDADRDSVQGELSELSEIIEEQIAYETEELNIEE